MMSPRLRLWLKRLAVAAAVLVAALLVWVVVSINSDSPVDYADIQEHFKYGSIGSEPGGSLLSPVGGVLPPYWVFTALPSVCRDKLPDGYATFGFVTEPGKDLPIGVSRRRRFGVDHVGLNCSVCHTATVRQAANAQPTIVLGMPAQQLDLQSFVQFVLDCTLDNRLTADAVRGRYPERGGPSRFERLLMRTGLIDRLKLQTLNLRNRMAPILSPTLPRWGRGRVDTFNPYKAIQFNWDLSKLPGHELIGASDFPSIWNQKPREGMDLHWDGDNDSVDERNLSASLGAGVTPVTVDHERLRRVREWIWTLEPPRYPFAVDQALVQKGAPLYQQHCVQCHAGAEFRSGTFDPKAHPDWKVGRVEPIDRIQTDRHRLDSYTFTFALNQYGLYPASAYQFRHFRKTNGYANQPLDAIWLRGPFLHNGSVPTLRDLLDAPEQRPARFYRGYDVFDQEKVGFVSDVPAANGQVFTTYDTTIPGNSNAGHVYGTGLSVDDKRAIVEYMKTF